MSPARNRAWGTSRVTPLELLFDLVFLFTVTRVTHVVVDQPDLLGIGRAFVLLAIAYLVYDGYVWLMNELSAESDRPRLRVALLFSMVAFLVLAASSSQAFEGGQFVFGAALALAALIHAVLVVLLGSPQARRAMLLAGPINVFGALGLTITPLLPTGISSWAPLVTLGMFLLSVAVARRGGFDLAMEHIAERHGLLMIIVFGEAIVGVGSGLADTGWPLDALIAAVLAVGVVGGLWWTYFSGSDLERAVDRIRAARIRERASISVRAFFLDHLVMMFGLVLFAAGISLAYEGSLEPVAAPTAFLTSGGVGLYLVAQAIYRRDIGVGGVRPRVIGGFLAPALGIVGWRVSPLVELAALIVLIGAVIVVSSRRMTTAP